MPAATPTLAFCLTTLPRPGMARSSAPNSLLMSCVFTPGATPIQRLLRHAFVEHLVEAERRNRPSRFPPPSSAIRRRGGHSALRPSVPEATAISSPCCNPRLHDFDMAARGLNFAKPLRPWLWRKILQAA